MSCPRLPDRRALLLASLLLLGGAPAARADVIVVTPEHPLGLSDENLHAALEAAQPGDTILIRPGSYTLTDPQGDDFDFDVTRSVTLIGDEGGEVILQNVVVSGLGPGDRVVLKNLTIDAVFTIGGPRPGLLIEDSDGVVLVEDCTIVGDPGGAPQFVPIDGGAGVRVDASAGVILSRSAIRGGDGVSTQFFDIDPPAGGEGLLVSQGTVAVYHCELTGGAGGSNIPFDNGGERGGAGARLTDADVRFVGATATGGPGGDGCPASAPDPCVGGDGLVAISSFVRATSASFTGGAGGELLDLGSAPDGADTLLQGSVLASFPDQPPRFDGPAVLREGEATTLSISGEPGTLLHLYFALGFQFAPLGGKKGVFVPAAPFLGPIVVGTLPPAGQLDIPLVGPDLAGLDGFMTTWQAFTIGATGFIAANPYELLLARDGL